MSSIFNRAVYGVAVTINVGCIVHVIAEYFAELTLLVGPSMLPTLNADSSGDIVVTEHLTTRFKALQKGDVVIARSPQEPASLICKRIVATSGDIVETGPEERDYIKIPKGHVWLQGDNLLDSVDSRDYGPVPYGMIRGRVCYRIWPFFSFGSIPGYPKK